MKFSGIALVVFVFACGSSSKKAPDAGADAPPVSIDARPDAPPDAPPDAAVAQITSLMPTKGIVTTAVTINGSSFGTQQGTVTVGGVAATVTSWSDTAIAITIPDVLPGDADVVVTVGTATAGPATFTVILPPAIYVDNGASGADTVSALAFDPATGAATQIGAEVAVGAGASGYGGCATSIWVNAHTRHLFVGASSAVAVFDIDPVTGAITAITGSPFSTGGTSAYGVFTNAAGDRLWVANYGSSNVSVFDLAADGTPTAVTGSPFAAGLSADTATLSKDETLLYGNHYGGSFTGFTASSTGTLTALGPQQGSGGTGIMRRPGTDQLFVPTTSNTVAVWTAAADGSVTQLTGSPFSVGAATNTIQDATFSPDGNRLYFAVYNSGSVAGFNLAADGTPTAITGSPWTVGGTFSACSAISQDGSYMIATNTGGSSVGVFALDATGAPTAVTGSPYTFTPTNTAGNGLAITF